jgi:hypothetical protein
MRARRTPIRVLSSTLKISSTCCLMMSMMNMTRLVLAFQGTRSPISGISQRSKRPSRQEFTKVLPKALTTISTLPMASHTNPIMAQASASWMYDRFLTTQRVPVSKRLVSLISIQRTITSLAVAQSISLARGRATHSSNRVTFS